MTLIHIRRRVACVAVLATAVAMLGGLVTPVSEADAFPATSKATVINYLNAIKGTNIVSGQHNKEPASSPAQYTNIVTGVTGQTPGLWGGDMMFRSADINNRQLVIDEAKRQWAAGSLVTLTWHACSPTVASTCEFAGGVNTQISNAQFQEIVTGGTTLNNTWRSRMAAVVPYLQQLKAAGVPVLWRPFHEMNETWNWWGGRSGVNGGAKIYQQMKDYFDSQGLDNLIWVWNVQDNPAGGWAGYYPGNTYVDVVSIDAWYKNYPSAADYSQMQTIAGTKPMVIAEMGKMPDAAFLSSQPRWSYFMLWSEQLQGNNTNAEIQATYFNTRVLNRGEVNLGGGTTTPTNPPAARTGAIIGLASKCVDVAAAGTANGTAVQLYTCAAGVAQTWTIATDGTIRNPNSNKCLTVVGSGTANGTLTEIRDCVGSNAQKWTYDSSSRLRNTQSNRCLDVTGQNSANGTRLQIWDCNTQTNQRWTLPA